MARVGVTNIFLQFSQPSALVHSGLSQAQRGGETEYVISGRNALCAGGVGAGFSNDQTHELLSFPLNAATGETGERG